MNETIKYLLLEDKKWIFGTEELKNQYSSGNIKDQQVEAWDFTEKFSGDKIDTLLISDIF